MKKWMREYVSNLSFLLLTFGTGVFYFCFYTVGLVFSLSLCFTVVGLPSLMYVMRTTGTFMNYDRIQTKLYTDISIEPITKHLPSGSYWSQVREELGDRTNWRAIVVLMLKFLVGIISLFGAVLFYIVPVLWIVAPWVSPFVDVRIGLIQVDSFPKSVLVLLLGLLLAYGGLWAGKGTVKLMGKYTRWMFKVWR